MPLHRPASGLLRRRSAVALAIVIGALGVIAAHGLLATGHNGTGHEGIAVGDMAAVCLAVTATAATAAAVLSRPGCWTQALLSFSWRRRG